MRVVLGLLVVVHGVMAWPGFAVPWELLSSSAAPYTTLLAFGAIDVGETGIRLFGLLWMAASVTFIVAGIAFALGARWAVPVIVATAAFQFVLAVLNVPWAWEGCVLDAVILLGIGLAAAGHLAVARPTTLIDERR